MSDIKISVCIPVYGVEKYIERCARSLFAQTMKDGIEFIFVNDCTKDKSIEIIEQILEEYPYRKNQVKIIHHEKNSGLVAARKTGLAHSAGDYIIHCDSDDWVDFNMYETMYSKALEKDSDVVISSYLLEYSNGFQKTFKVMQAATPGEYFQNNSTCNFNTLCTKLFRREIALSQDLICPDNISLGEDLLRNVQMMYKCDKITFCPDIYYHYFRDNDSSITRQFTSKSFQELYEAVNLLHYCKFDIFPQFQLLLKSIVLFDALKLNDFDAKKYRNLFSRDVYWRVPLVRYIPLWKRLLLFIANISYGIANKLCYFLLNFKAKIKL